MAFYSHHVFHALKRKLSELSLLQLADSLRTPSGEC